MADNMMKKWYDAAKHRVSVRRYTGGIDKNTFYELKDFASQLCNDEARIELRAKGGVLENPFLLSFFGGVEGTNCFAAVIIKNDNDYMGGYLGEAFVLECTSRGIGTCWLGATYKRRAAKQYIQLGNGEKLIAVIAFGKMDEVPKAPVKKTAEQLTGLSSDVLKALPEWQQEAVRITKLAPSARNKQPWEIEIDENSVALYTNSSNFGYGDLDCGIAMLHLELGAAKFGIAGEWKLTGNEKRFVPFNVNLNEAMNEAEE